MIKLYGFAVSNYFNMVRFSLLAKGIEHQIVNTVPSQEPEFLAKSPRGMVPVLETEYGFISETSAILEYIEELYPTPALLPTTSFERAKVRELTRLIELYIELPARRLYGEVIFQRPTSDKTKEQVKKSIDKGVAALHRVANFGPYITGDQLTISDIYLYYSLSLANKVSLEIFDQDILEQLPAAKPLFERLSKLPYAQIIAADSQEAFASFQGVN